MNLFLIVWFFRNFRAHDFAFRHDYELATIIIRLALVDEPRKT